MMSKAAIVALVALAAPAIAQSDSSSSSSSSTTGASSSSSATDSSSSSSGSATGSSSPRTGTDSSSSSASGSTSSSSMSMTVSTYTSCAPSGSVTETTTVDLPCDICTSKGNQQEGWYTVWTTVYTMICPTAPGWVKPTTATHSATCPPGPAPTWSMTSPNWVPSGWTTANMQCTDCGAASPSMMQTYPMSAPPTGVTICPPGVTSAPYVPGPVSPPPGESTATWTSTIVAANNCPGGVNCPSTGARTGSGTGYGTGSGSGTGESSCPGGENCPSSIPVYNSNAPASSHFGSWALIATAFFGVAAGMVAL